MFNYIHNNTDFKTYPMAKRVSHFMLILALCLLAHSAAYAETIQVGKEFNEVKVLSSRGDGCTLDVTIGEFEQKPVLIN